MNAMALMALVETGIAELDEEHGKMALLLAEVVAAARDSSGADAVLDILADLKHVSERHFRTEEALMAAIGYGDRLSHKALHDDAVARIGNVIADIRGTGAPRPEMFMPFLIWLQEHLRTADMDLAEAIRGRRRV